MAREFPALQAKALVCVGQCRIAWEKQGGAYVEYGRGRGLVKFWHPLNFHWTRTGQVQGLEVAVDSV